MTRQAVSDMGYDSGKVAFYRTALEALSEQLTGTAGGVLAGVATKVMLIEACQRSRARPGG